jgi:hypothetical protein
MGWGAGQGITNNLAGRPMGRGFVLWAVLCGHAPLSERFCVWAAFCGAVLLITLWSALPLPNLCFFMGGGGGVVQGITNNLAGRPLGHGFVLWAVLCGHAPLPERFCVWAAFCGAALLTNSVVRPPPSLCLCLFFQVFSSLFYFEYPNLGFSWGGGRVKGLPTIWQGDLWGAVLSCGPCSVVMPRCRSGFVCGPLFAGLSC